MHTSNNTIWMMMRMKKKLIIINEGHDYEDNRDDNLKKIQSFSYKSFWSCCLQEMTYKHENNYIYIYIDTHTLI